jgi:hypothetical protein
MPADKITSVNDLGLALLLFLGIFVFLLPRRFVFVPLLLSACYMTLGQVIVFAGLSFTIYRIMILTLWIRIFMRREIQAFTLNGLDKAIIFWVIASFVTGILLEPTTATVINRLGLIYDALGIYLLFRFLIREFDDISRIINCLAIAAVPLAIAMLIENVTARNAFSLFGGVPEMSLVREGRVRCSGSFAHPILAGTFGATLIPLFVGLWFRKGSPRVLAIVGTIAAATITLTSSSSGPLMSTVLGVIALALWRFRRHMRFLLWVGLFTLIALHFIMRAPVWYLIARISNLSGGDGWHRADLIDAAINHLSDWWLFGTTYTTHWIMHDTSNNPGMVDITNQYILEGVKGGLLKLVLFVTIIVIGFRKLGGGIQLTKNQPFATRFTMWTLGCALFVHVVSFMSVSYFDQTWIFWYLLLAMISTTIGLSDPYSYEKQK